MDTLTNLTEIVRREVKWYALPGLQSTSYFFADDENHVYTVIDVPDATRKFRSKVALIVRVVGDKVIIEEDQNDRPLWETLVQQGIPRENIILTYAGESASIPT